MSGGGGPAEAVGQSGPGHKPPSQPSERLILMSAGFLLLSLVVKGDEAAENGESIAVCVKIRGGMLVMLSRLVRAELSLIGVGVNV